MESIVSISLYGVFESTIPSRAPRARGPSVMSRRLPPRPSRHVPHPAPLPVLLLALLLAACGGSVKELDGAVATIPIFSPASLKERTTAFTSDDIGDMMKFSTYTWYLETDASPMTVDAFYMAQWPGASRREDAEEIIIRNPPFPADEDAPLGESVLVTIKLLREGGKTQFSISEDVFRAKRR